MIPAYNIYYVLLAQHNLAIFLDYSVNYLHFPLHDIWNRFLSSKICDKFMDADPQVMAGRSGIELVFDVLGKEAINVPEYTSIDKSPEYWLGYYLAYFQWRVNLSFRQLEKYIKIEEILEMYHPYHEMDLENFIIDLGKKYNERKGKTNLEIFRKELNMSRADLSKQSNVPVRTIEHYEQRVVDINNASSKYIISLAKALYKKPEELLEIEI